MRGHRQQRPLRARVLAGRARCSGEDGERRLVKDALGEPVSMVETKRSEPGENLHLTLDARIQERTEAVLGEVGQTYTPQGATAVVMDPRTRRGARAGQLAARGRQQRRTARPRTRARTARSRRTTSPARPSRRSPCPGALEEQLVEPGTTLVGAARDHRWPTGPSARRTTAAAGTKTRGARSSRESSNVGSVMIGLKLGAKRFDKWVRRFGFGRPTGVDLPGEEGGIVPAPGALLGLVDGQHADRPGHRGHADADGHRLHGDRQPRRDAPPVHRQGRRQPPPKRVLSRRTAEQVSHMLEGVLGRGRHGAGGPGRGLHARRQDRHGREGDQGRLLEDGLHRLVHRLRAGEGPAPAGGGDGRHAARRHLRRHRGGARLRAHHGVRAAVPEDPAAARRRGRRPRPSRPRRAGGAPRASAPAPAQLLGGAL